MRFPLFTKNTLRSTSFILTLFLAGCVTIYEPPKYGEPTATVQGMKDNGLFNWSVIAVTEIDNHSVGFKMTPAGTLRIYPGNHMLTLNSQFKRGPFSPVYFAVIDVSANFKASQHYKIKSNVDGSRLNAWVEDANGHRVSPISSSNYH
ncbi:MAG: hypothetical protein WC785_07470 [Tatlockia sp.]|jgi:predicted membrane protein